MWANLHLLFWLSLLPFALLDELVVDAGVAELHVSKFVELPVLVAVGAIPLAGGVVKLIFKSHGDAVAGEGPQGFLQTIVKFTLPLAAEKFHDLLAATHEVSAVAPFGVFGERREWWSGVHGVFWFWFGG